MRRRFVFVFAIAASMLGIAAAFVPSAHAATGVGKTGVYKDACGNNHVWVNGKDLGPEYFVCIPPE